MHTVAVVNPKGGCGKTTIATGLAGWLAYDHEVALGDLDAQQSAVDWLRSRTEDYPAIAAVPGDAEPFRAPAGSDYFIIDAPAGMHGTPLRRLVERADRVVVPVIPSPIDLRAAWRYLEHLFSLKTVTRRRGLVGLVGNRVQVNTIIYRELTGFMDELSAPFVTHLRETQNYIHAARAGLAVTELPYWRCWRDCEEWEPLVEWVTG